MNPPNPFLSAPPPALTFTPPFNPNFVHSHFNNQNYPSSHLPPTTIPAISQPPPPPSILSHPPPLTDLPTALSTLKDLIRLSETTLDSISTLLRYPTPGSNLCRCPFDRHHRVPPEFLFKHSLQCPSSPARAVDGNLVKSLRYPNTLQSSDELIKQNLFVQTLHDLKTELCFTLDEYFDFCPNFFYRDCPGVVSSSDQDGMSRTFTVPGILLVECANFICPDKGEIRKSSIEHIKLLPSEMWLVRTEMEIWNDFPSTYSHIILRAILCCNMVQEKDFMRWVMVNSPYYSILIDEPMRDHMFLLFQFCLKAIVSEAVDIMNLASTRECKELNVAATSFKCPILVEVLGWLSSQFSVLYGMNNGKLFAINMFKQWILNASLNSSLFPVVQNVSQEVDVKSVKSSVTLVKNEKNNILGETVEGRVIFVSQVAAAVAALHERALLERKIKALCVSQQLTSYQRMAEHAYMSKRADEERHKRSNYRPLLEHDGLFWQRHRDEGTNKVKTKEELLAEERDYKRRRMSYRGKKLKRSTTQVIRDIIEDHMEVISQAGGIGCSLKGAEEAVKLSSVPSPLHEIPTRVPELKKNASNLYNVSREYSTHSDKKQSYSSRFEDKSTEGHKRSRKGYSEHREGRRSVDGDSHNRVSYSESPGRHRNSDRSHDQSRKYEFPDVVELPRENYHRSPNGRHSRSRDRPNCRRERGDRNSETVDRRRKHADGDRRSGSFTSHEFQDRYDPSQSEDTYDDEVLHQYA